MFGESGCEGCVYSGKSCAGRTRADSGRISMELEERASVGAALRPARRVQLAESRRLTVGYPMTHTCSLRFAGAGRRAAPRRSGFFWSTAPLPCFVTHGHQRKLLNITKSESFTRARVTAICLPSGE